MEKVWQHLAAGLLWLANLFSSDDDDPPSGGAVITSFFAARGALST